MKFQTHDDAQLEAMVEACRVFALSFKRGLVPRWLSLLGNSGTGKTHCGRRLWNHLSSRLNWGSAEFIHSEIYWPKFVSELRSGNSFSQYRDMMKWPVLFLDDIGAERDTTGFAAEQLNALIGSRENKWTIITSNLNLEQLAKIDPRIADRIIRSPNPFAEIETKSHAVRVVEK